MGYPWYMEPSNMVIVIFFLYITGFGICSVMFHKLYTDHKLEKGIDPKMSKTETHYLMGSRKCLKMMSHVLMHVSKNNLIKSFQNNSCIIKRNTL